MRGAEVEQYDVALLMWYFGLTGEEVRAREWTQADIDKADAYADYKGVDVEEWEKKFYGQEDWPSTYI